MGLNASPGGMRVRGPGPGVGPGGNTHVLLEQGHGPEFIDITAWFRRLQVWKSKQDRLELSPLE